MEPNPKMDLEGESSALESVQDNEEIGNDSVSENLGITTESNVQSNGSYVVENNESHPLELKPEEVSPLPTSVRKGAGLRKWRRIRRDSNRIGDSSIDTDRTMVHDLPNLGVKPSKRMQYTERKQMSEGSVSSTNAVVRNLDGFAQLDDSGHPFAAGTDSENSEGQSSRSSTAASAPRIKNEIPMFMGSPRDNSLSGKNLAHTVQRGRQEKGRTESTKKARGERVKIEKENSHSSLESDSRSSNFVFMQGTYPVNNGLRNERPNDYDEEDSYEFMGSGQQIDNEHRGGYGKDGEGGYGDLSPVAGSSSQVKEKRSENHCSVTEQDPLDESISALHSAQEALEKEVLKFKEIGNSASDDGSISNLCTEFTDEEQKLDRTRGEQSQGASQSEVVETENGGIISELEDLFKQKVEAEVEFLAISRTVQNLRVAAVDRITVIEEQKALASEQTQILDKLEEAENKAAVLKKDADKLENFCQDIASADEILKLEKRVGKYRSCFMMQIVLFVVILAILASRFSPSHVEFVPT